MYDTSNEDIFIFDSDSSNADVLRSSPDEDPELEESEDSNDSQETSIDYTSSLDDVNSSLESLILQTDNLNENVCIMNENLKLCIGLECAIVFFLLLKTGYHILNNLLGLGKV